MQILRRYALSLLGAVLVAGPLMILGMSSLQASSTPKFYVTAYLASECPVALRITLRLNEIVEEYSKQGVEFEGLFPQTQDTREKIEEFKKDRGLLFECRLDPYGRSAIADGVDIVPFFILRDERGNVLYRGALDDHKVDEFAKNHYLRDALDAVLQGESPVVDFGEPFGCFLMTDIDPIAMEQVTYADHIAEIIDRHCVSCHRPGEAAPFSLIGYDNAQRWARMIAYTTETRVMPPWKAVQGYGRFMNENRLTEEQIELLKAWEAAGAPMGDESRIPEPPKFDSEWMLGEPDLILQLPEEFPISADGRDEYWHFVLEPDIDETVYVTAMDVKPGNRRIVHHVIAFLDEHDQSTQYMRRRGIEGFAYETFGSPGFIPTNSLGGWAPGMVPEELPGSAGIELKPGTKVVLQVHYNKSGRPEVDQTRVGLYFSKEPPEEKVLIEWIANPMIRIQPDRDDQVFRAAFTVPRDANVYRVMPHMHLLGRSMKAWAELPDGKTEPLVWVDDWDFNWQFFYTFQKPLKLPAGSRIRVEAVYDNTTANPNNPSNPPRLVTWGEQTTDEMLLLVVALSYDQTGGPIPTNPLQRIIDLLGG